MDMVVMVGSGSWLVVVVVVVSGLYVEIVSCLVYCFSHYLYNLYYRI